MSSFSISLSLSLCSSLIGKHYLNKKKEEVRINLTRSIQFISISVLTQLNKTYNLEKKRRRPNHNNRDEFILYNSFSYVILLFIIKIQQQEK